MPDEVKIAHIGVAVADISAAATFYQDVLGAALTPHDDVDGAAIVSLPFGDIDIELLEPRSDDGPIGKFLSQRGPGIHHICFRVPNLDAAVQRCRDQGYRLIDPEPRTGAHGRRIVFLHPKSTSGILLQLTE